MFTVYTPAHTESLTYACGGGGGGIVLYINYVGERLVGKANVMMMQRSAGYGLVFGCVYYFHMSRTKYILTASSR
jgi:hypothetical protein